MCVLIYFLGLVILLANSGQCDLSWDKVYNLLSSRLDNILVDIKLEQNAMRKEIQDLMATVTATNQQVIAFEMRLSEVAILSQQMVVFQERLDNMETHVKDVAAVEVGRRTHLLRHGLQKEKEATQTRLNSVHKIQEGVQSDINVLKSATEDFRVHISNVEEKIKSTMNQTAELVSRTEDEMSTHLNKTRVQISNLEQGMADSVGRIEGLEKTQSVMKGAADKTQAQIATVEQKVAASQSNTQTLQSRVQSLEGSQVDLKSKTITIESQVGTTRGQISRLQQTLGTFVGFSTRLNPGSTYYNKATEIKFDQIIYNEGSHYSPSTGIFTVPVSGVYIFMFNVQVTHDSSDTNLEARFVLKKNGYVYSEAIVTGVGPNLTGGNAAVLKALAGDRVYVSTANLEERYYIWPWRTSFSGALLHVI